MDDSFSEKGGASMMTRMKEWLSMVTLGQVRNYLRILLWNVFDSFVASIPTAVLLLALYCFFGAAG